MELRSQLGMIVVNDEAAANVDNMPMLANNVSTVDDFLEEKTDSYWGRAMRAAKTVKKKMAAAAKAPWSSKKWNWSSFFYVKETPPTPLAEEMCKAPRNLPHSYKGFFNNDCSLTEQGQNCTRNFIEYNGTIDHPKWNVRPLACNGVIHGCTDRGALARHAHTDFGWPAKRLPNRVVHQYKDLIRPKQAWRWR